MSEPTDTQSRSCVSPASPATVQVFVGETRSTVNEKAISENGFGRIWNVGRPRAMKGEPWAFDNGSYAQFLKAGGRPYQFASGVYMRRMEAAMQMATLPYMVILPDLVGAGVLSIGISVSWIQDMPRRWRDCLYLAVQDGMTINDVQKVCDRFYLKGLFLGGTDKFKQTALAWSNFAHEMGMQFHFGRAGTIKKIRASRWAHADSLDSSFPLWEKRRWADFVAIFNEPDPQADLFGELR